MASLRIARSITRLSALTSVGPATSSPRPANMNLRIFTFANNFWAPRAMRFHSWLGTKGLLVTLSAFRK